MIKHIHVNDCDSTQDLLKEQLKEKSEDAQILISCENQNQGRGRGNKNWTALPGSVCFSFNIAPHPEMSFTALEISVLVARFFENKGRLLKLKWPNDLWDNQERKCGGILIQGSNNIFMAGIGINLYSDIEDFGGIYDEAFKVDKKQCANEIAHFIIQNRYPDVTSLQRDWLKRCGHLNQMVKVTEGSEVIEGIFQGIGQHGEALICRDTKTVKVFNGSLRTI